MLYPRNPQSGIASTPNHVFRPRHFHQLPIEARSTLHKECPLPASSFKVTGENGNPNQPTICLLPGLFMRHSAYSGMAEALTARGMRVVTLEFPNQPSHLERADYVRLIDYALYLDSFLNTLGIEPENTLFFGMSFGAQILRVYHTRLNKKCKAMMLCSLFPWELAATQVVEKMQLIDLIERGNFEAFVHAFAMSLYSAVQKSRDPDCVQRSIDNITNNFSQAPLKAKYLMMATMSAALENQTNAPFNEQWNSPTMVIVPKYDAMSHEHMQEYLAQHGVPSLVLPYGHVFTVECPNYMQYVNQWIERHVDI